MRQIAAFKMLFHDRATALGAIAGVIAIVFLVGQQLSIFFGLLSYMSFLVDNSSADLWICSRNTENVNSGGTIPADYRDRIRGVTGIAWAEPVIIGGGVMTLEDGRFQSLQIFGSARPRLIGGPTMFHKGSIEDLLDREGISVDQLDLRTLNFPAIGDWCEINNRRVRIRAITRGMKGFSGNVVFTNIDKARELTGTPPWRCSSILVKLNEGYEKKEMIQLLRRILPRAEVLSREELSGKTQIYYLKNTGIGGSFGFTTLVGTLVGVVIISLTMYTNVLNKTTEFAVLRALGGRKQDVIFIVFMQSLYIGIIGLIAGFTLLALFLNGVKDTSLPSFLPWWVPLIHALATVFLCMLGSFIAMRRVVRIDPAMAFR